MTCELHGLQSNVLFLKNLEVHIIIIIIITVNSVF